VAQPIVIAHRGDSAHRPENTLASLAAALELGVEAVEFDVQLTRDGQAVVIHDPTLDRTTSGSGEVRGFTLAEVRAVSAGYPTRFGAAYAGERVPTLGEALSLVQGRARALIEIKAESVSDDATGGIEAVTVAEVRRAGMAGRVALISFDQRVVLRRTTAEEVLRDAAAASCELVMPHKSQLSEPFAERLRGAGLKLATWVVDEPEELLALARFGLYGVGSNCPGVLLDALADGLLSAAAGR
jgi:glycerophosphoryl diester phosphodiesterase